MTRRPSHLAPAGNARHRSGVTGRLPDSVQRQWRDTRQQISTLWGQRSARERILLAGCSAVMLLAAGWLVGVEPALNRIQRLQTELPRLRTQSTEIETVVQQALASRRAGPSLKAAPSDTESVRRALADSLDSAALKNTYTLEPAAGGVARWQVQFKDAPVRAVVPWMLQSPAELGLSVDSVALERPDAAPVVPAGMTWVPPANAPQPAASPAARSRPSAGRMSGQVILAPPSQEDKDKS
ncbi:General secretion pathway%2C M protein [Bordetella ansorpii]|uniref:General secretion pathway, M protein n=1 Tax=Bordetella ansorpii TaxID=288768 RepID=A0A157QKI5_9BORD|nr:type II secretion system protein GspM [Bordetella ansorpii]SAI46287.1 General secretion pathway%2C M protein [Bordetella ansorpii]